ncbi:hypothetical protein GCM10023314_15150 [Algibacter agarivorans]|uniref:Methyltransferase domain-containing protein n=1 Tax=Algibacter agarivorans TaxID=1109741 RepID=A0ABP9GH94_9FLAO
MNKVSDKIFWHKFDVFYEPRLPNKEASNILEIGVFEGNSIKYWRERYKLANIFGIDIIGERESWPKDNNIKYFEIDQSDVTKYRLCLSEINKIFDIVIEDGSHDPLHQKISLIETLPYLEKGSVYILEDIHTSHVEHPLFKSRLNKINSSLKFFKKKKIDYYMTLQCLLHLEHFKRMNRTTVDFNNSINFKQSLFTEEELILLYNKVKKIEIFKRSILPDYCYACNRSDFNYMTLKCKCGTDLYSNSDSMTAMLYF